MTEFHQDFTIHAGQNATLKPVVRDKDAAPVNGVYPLLDLSAATAIEWRAAPGRDQPATITKSLAGGEVTFTTDGTDGALDVDIATTDFTVAGRWFHQLWVTLGGREWPALDGELTLVGSVT